MPPAPTRGRKPVSERGGDRKQALKARVNGKSKAPSEVDQAARRARVLELRRANVPFRIIGQREGIDAATAYRDYARAIDELLPVELVEQARRAEMDRIDGLRMNLWPKATAGDVHAVTAWTRLAERYARLGGLDVPMTLNINFTETHMVWVIGALRGAVEQVVPPGPDRVRILDAFTHGLDQAIAGR